MWKQWERVQVARELPPPCRETGEIVIASLNKSGGLSSDRRTGGTSGERVQENL